MAGAVTVVVNISDCPPGWQADSSYVYVGRSLVRRTDAAGFGNPHPIGLCYRCDKRHDRAEAVRLHAEEVRRKWALEPDYRAGLEVLRGRRLVCYCAPLSCHADVYVELLEGGRG